ncbi:hypothetical protein Tco_1239693 [Tanacetum coccineum]
MFHNTLQLLVETLENLFVAPVNIEIIESFMHTVGYQGVVDKVSAFYMKFLAQPWQAMFKDFMNCVSQKKDFIQYPRFIKLIIADLMKKFPSIPLRLEEDYHSIKDEISLEIRATNDYKEYETVFVNVVVLMNQPQSVVSTQRTYRSTPRAHRTPTLTTASPQGKKRKKSDGETSSPQKLLKVTTKQKQVVEGEKDEESYADKFVAYMIHDDVDDSGDRIEPGSHKEHPKVVDDDNKEEKKDEKEDNEIGSLEIRTEKMQTQIPIIPRSPRINLSLDKNIAQELTDNMRQGYMIMEMECKCVTTDEFWKVHGKVDQVLHEIMPQLAEKATNDLIKDNLKIVVADTVIQEVKRHKTSKSLKSERGSSSKRSAKDSTAYVSKQQQEWDAWEETQVIDEYEVIPEDKTPELITKFQNLDMHVPTIFDRARMEATLNDMLSNQFKNTEEYAYHLEQATNFIENQIVWESKQEDIRRPVPRPLIFFRPQRNPNKPLRYLYSKDLFFLKNGNTKDKKYILSLHKIHAERFPEADLEEKMNRWIIEVVRITTDQPHGLDFMEQIIVMRENDKPGSFSKADFKYLNKNDIEDWKYEKRVMYLVQIVKFCDATLENVLKEVKLKIFQSEPWNKPPLLGELDRDIMRVFEREIIKRLRH